MTHQGTELGRSLWEGCRVPPHTTLPSFPAAPSNSSLAGPCTGSEPQALSLILHIGPVAHCSSAPLLPQHTRSHTNVPQCPGPSAHGKCSGQAEAGWQAGRVS